MIIYIDAQHKCHVVDDGNMIAVETDFFNGKCAAFIEGYKLVPAETEYNGKMVVGDMYFPWVDFKELEAAQIAYERQQYTLLRAENADMKAALEVMEVTA